MKKLISLYSGCGGLDLGFHKAGFETMLAMDISKISCETLSLNKVSRKIINDDIRNISFKKYFNKIDGVIGGPPCPPYSQSRHYLTKKKNGFGYL